MYDLKTMQLAYLEALLDAIAARVQALGIPCQVSY